MGRYIRQFLARVKTLHHLIQLGSFSTHKKKKLGIVKIPVFLHLIMASILLYESVMWHWGGGFEFVKPPSRFERADPSNVVITTCPIYIQWYLGRVKENRTTGRNGEIIYPFFFISVFVNPVWDVGVNCCFVADLHIVGFSVIEMFWLS